MTDGQDQWGVAYSSFILAKQAGFDIEFQHGNQPIKDAQLYILPSIKGLTLINRKDWLGILDKVKEGASLYVSYDQGFLSHFLEPAGFEVVTSQNRNDKVSFVSTDGSIKPFSMSAGRKLNLKTTTAKVLGKEADGNPIFTVNNYGKGKIYFLGLQMEMNLTRKPGAFTENPAECWKIYQTISADIVAKNRAVTKNDPFVGITEHDLSATEKVIVLVNYSPEEKEVALTINSGWKVEKSLYGNLPAKSSVKLKANDACVLQLKK